MHPRTLPDLPLAPFAPLSRKKWFTRMEKKPRVEIVDDNPPSFVGGDLSIDDFEKLSMSDFTPRSGAAGSMRTKSVAGDGRSMKGEDWRDIERSEVMSKMTPRTNVTRPSSRGTGMDTTSPGQTTPGGDTSLSGPGSKVYQGRRRRDGGSQTSRSGSYTHRSKASQFSQAYSSAMSVNEEDEQGEVKLSKQQELFLLYQVRPPAWTPPLPPSRRTDNPPPRGPNRSCAKMASWASGRSGPRLDTSITSYSGAAACA